MGGVVVGMFFSDRKERCFYGRERVCFWYYFRTGRLEPLWEWKGLKGGGALATTMPPPFTLLDAVEALVPGLQVTTGNSSWAQSVKTVNCIRAHRSNMSVI